MPKQVKKNPTEVAETITATTTPAVAVEAKERGGLAQALLPLKAALDRYKSLQGQGKFSEAGSELERIERLIQRMISGD